MGGAGLDLAGFHSAKLYRPQQSSGHRGATAGDAPANEVFRWLGLAQDRAELVQQVHRGFSAALVETLASELHVPQHTVA
jgi:hypothetical protein